MLPKINYKFIFATALSFGLINSVELQLLNSNFVTWLNISNEALARSSGGRGRGGSFSRPSRSGGSDSPGSNSYNRNRDYDRRDSDYYYRRDPGYGYGGPNVVVVPGGGGYSSGMGIFPMLLVLGMFGLISLLVLSNRLRTSGSFGNNSYYPNGFSSPTNERDNDLVTISKLQVALFATTKGLQSELSQLTLNANTETPEGLLEFLQESALVLLRNYESWSHVLASSESLSIEKAESRFNQLSMEERSKFSAETLTNVRGTVKRKEVEAPGLEEDPAAYIVVTLLVGTAYDKPLFKEILTAEEMKEALEKLASVPPDYLMTFELLWSPQVETDSLTYDELLTEYTKMVQVA